MRSLAMLAGAAGLSLALTLAAVPATAGEPTSLAVRVGVRHNMEATLYTPDGPGPFPTVLVLHTSLGLTETDKGWGLKLAREGFICIVPAFLLAHGNVTGNMRSLAFTKGAQVIYDDLVETIDELNHLPKARPGAVGAIGFSNGGYFTLWLAATRQVKAGISYYGALQGGGTDPRLTRFQSVFNSESSPVMVLSGQDDLTIGIGTVHRFIGLLRRNGAPHEVHIYPDAEHDFDRTNMRPGNQAAAADAWLRTLAFFRQNLH